MLNLFLNKILLIHYSLDFSTQNFDSIVHVKSVIFYDNAMLVTKGRLDSNMLVMHHKLVINISHPSTTSMLQKLTELTKSIFTVLDIYRFKLQRLVKEYQKHLTSQFGFEIAACNLHNVLSIYYFKILRFQSSTT